MAPLRLALIGAGRRGRGAHLPVIARMSDRFRLLAVGDVDPAAARIADEYGARAYTSLRELVAQERPEAAVVTVPGDAHHAVVWFLAEHGVHVLVETPIAPMRAQADLMIAAAARNRVTLEVAENYYPAPVERLKSAVIAAGAIGQVSRLHRIFHEGGYHGMSLLRHHALLRTEECLLSHDSKKLPCLRRNSPSDQPLPLEHCVPNIPHRVDSRRAAASSHKPPARAQELYVRTGPR